MVNYLIKVIFAATLLNMTACLAQPLNVNVERRSPTAVQIKLFKAELVDKIIHPLNTYAKQYRETGKEYLLIAHPTMKTEFLSELIVSFDNVPLTYKPVLSYEKLKELMNKREIYFEDGFYNPEKLKFERADHPERVIYIDPLIKDKKSLRCQLIQYEKGKMVKLLKRGTLKMEFDIFGNCEACEKIEDKIQCSFWNEDALFKWKNIKKRAVKFHLLDIPPDKTGNYFYSLDFPEKKEISNFRYKQTIIIELDKTQDNNISDMAWYEPREEFLDRVPLNPDLSYLYLFICFNATDTYKWTFRWRPDPLIPKSFYSHGNHLETFRQNIVSRLPKKEVKIYALHK